MKEDVKYVLEAVQPPVLQQNDSAVKGKSSYFVQYSQKMSNYESFSNQAFNHILLHLLQEESVRFTEEFISKLQLRIIEESINKEVIVINVQWGYFSIDVKILNIQGCNPHHLNQLQRGMYGSIYNRKLNGQNFVIKCQFARFKNSRFRAIRQWFMMKLASIARVGPKVQSYIGFDILMFSQCVEFAMEECQQISVHNSKIDDFYENLAVLHKLQFVHQDIKPENIMYSPSFDKTVFIDFGLSSIISQKIGHKTLSNYVGTINFWSPEMAQCYADKKPKFIDLYYNDLFGLEKTIELLKQTTRDNAQEQYSEMHIVQKDGNSVYLSLFLGKFLIYCFQFQKFLQFYKNTLIQCSSSFINYYEAQILAFFEELSPTKDVRSFFKTYVTDKHKDTPIYLKLNILYQISQKNICSLEIFRNEEKYKYFSMVCTESMSISDENDELSQEKFNEDIAVFMVNEENIKQTPFLKYLSMYLDYISYICNKLQVSPEKRRQAAAVYHKLFIKGDILTKSSRQVVTETIIHAYQWLINRKTVSLEYKKDLPYVLFKIYDFLLILDFGTSEQYINRLENIYEHPSMTLIYKKIFLHRVLQINNLNVIRMIPKIDVSRSAFLYKINQWISKKRKKLEQFCQNKIKFTQHQIQQLPYQFQKDYGFQALQECSYVFKSAQHDKNETKMIEIYYKILRKNKKQKIMSILAILYNNSPLHKDSNHFIAQIQKIFKVSLRDESILNQFSFHLQSALIFGQLTYNSSQEINVDLLHKINEEYMKVATQDLFFFQHSILEVWNRAQRMEFKQKHNLQFLYEKEGILRRFFENNKRKQVYELQKDKHHCYNIVNLYDVLFYSKRFSKQIQKQTRADLKKQSIQIGKTCQKCQFASILIFQIDDLHQLLLQYCHRKTPEEKNQSIINFLCTYKQFCHRLINQQINSYMTLLIQKALTYGLIICFSSPQLQKRYQQIKKYIQFLYKFQMLYHLFVVTEHDFKLQYCLWVIKEKSISEMALFLFRLAQMFSKYQNMIWYDKLLKELKHIFSSLEQSQLYDLFCFLRKHQKQAKRENQDYVYVILIYIYIMDCSRSQKHINSSLKAILQNISNVRFNFRRKIVVVIYGKLFLQQYKSKRHQLYLKNRLIRLLMVDGQTVPCKELKQRKKNVKQKYMQIKLNKFDMYDHNRTLKITIKQTKQ